jgi:hypothetical protein
MTAPDQITIPRRATALLATLAAMATVICFVAAHAQAASGPSYATCRAKVTSSPVYLGGRDSSLACAQPCEAAIQRCMEHGGVFDR